MKTVIIFLILLSCSTISLSQQIKHPYYGLEIDTLSHSGNDSLWVNLQNYSRGVLKDEGTAFVIPDTLVVDRSRYLLGFFKRTVYCSKVIRDGQTVEYLVDSQKKVMQYQRGDLTQTRYYDCTGAEIAKPVTYGLNLGPCGIVEGEYIFNRAPSRRKRK